MPYQHIPFDFQLSSQQEHRAQRLHTESLIIDTLYQGPIGPDSFSTDLEDYLLSSDKADPADIYDLFKLRACPLRLACEGANSEVETQWRISGVTGGNREIELSSFELYADLIALANLQFDSLPWMLKANKASDFRRAKKEDKFAGYVTSQMVSGPFPSLSILASAAESGLRMLQLTYNEKNSLGSGCTDAENGGITVFGREAISIMNAYRVIVDISHSGKKTTLDACKYSKQPVVASHTMAQSLYHHDRAKSDDELKAIADTCGIIGVVAVPFFLSNQSQVSIHALLDHIDYLVDFVGSDHVSIGTDWPNQIPSKIMDRAFRKIVKGVGFKERHGVEPLAVLDGFRDYSDFSNITRGLVSRGHNDETIQKILGENFLRVFEEVCG